MRGRDFLDLAREIVAGGTERHWRGALGRAYYALMLEGREALAGWGFAPAPRENVHSFVRARFSFPAHPELKSIGDVLDPLGRQRNLADYTLAPGALFASATAAQEAIRDVTTALALLDAIGGDAGRRAAAAAAIRAAFP